MKVIVPVIVIALLSFAVSFAGIFKYIVLSAALQLLFQVLGIALVVLSLAACCMYKLNQAVDQVDKP
jgi:hypothetical protein